MTESTNPSNFQEPAKQLSERSESWLGDILDDVDIARELESVPPSERARVADLLFLDALLERVHSSDTKQLEARVQRVLSAIDESKDHRAAPRESTAPAADVTKVTSHQAAPGMQRSSRRRWLVSSLTVAAGIGGASAAWLLSGASSATAQGTVKLAYQESKLPEDRQYRVTTRLGAATFEPLVGELYVQGGDKFALCQPTLLGTRFWMGSNGDVAWLVPSVGPVLVSNKPELLRQWIEDRELNVPFLQITSVLELMKDDYELSRLGDEYLPGDRQTRWRRIRGTKDTTRPLFPAQIDAWVDPANGTVGRLELNWSLAKRALGLRQICFELVGRERMVGDWYDAAAHHGTARAVLAF